jgi:hypothetical protein
MFKSSAAKPDPRPAIVVMHQRNPPIEYWLKWVGRVDRLDGSEQQDMVPARIPPLRQFLSHPQDNCGPCTI